MRTFASVDELAGAVGEVIGPGSWFTVDQDRIDAFAEATGDHQWIHTDPARAASGPFGGTVAHGYLTLSLLPTLTRDLYRVEGVTMAVNYGLNKVRFPTPARSGGRFRATVRVDQVSAVSGGAQLVCTATVAGEGEEKPCCVAETVARLYLPDTSV